MKERKEGKKRMEKCKKNVKRGKGVLFGIQCLPKFFGSPRGPYAKTLFLQSSKYYSFLPNSFKFGMYIGKSSENTSDFFRFLFSFSIVLLAGSKSLWNAERTLCKLGHFCLFFQLNG
jgi:hypothetical protein